MNIFRWLQAPDEKRVAADMARVLVQELPPALMDERRHVLSVNRVTRVLERTLMVATQHQRKCRLGLLGRARLANHFKWCLKTEGYAEDFVDMATEALVMELAKAARSPKT